MTDFENSSASKTRPLTVGDWFVILLLTSIPLVNIILLFVWAFSSDTHPTKKNFAKALLIWMLIPIALFFLFASLGLWSFMAIA